MAKNYLSVHKSFTKIKNKSAVTDNKRSFELIKQLKVT